MDNLHTVLWILAPLFIGFAIRMPKNYLPWLDKSLNTIVYVILWLIGTGLAQVDNLAAQLDNIALYSALLWGCTIVCNLLMLIILDKLLPYVITQPMQAACTSVSIMGSIKQLATVLLGLAFGLLLPHDYLPPHQLGTYALMLLVLMVGMQLRANNITLRQILLNTRGIQLSVVFIVSCGIAGCLFALCLDQVSLAQGLAMASGYGWYSLSGIVMTQAYGATWGSVALLNDLCRELFALVAIPMLMRRYPSTAVGIGGATSLDFTLPIIQSSGGIHIVPVAISFGFIVNIVSPLLMVLFSSWR